MKSGDLAQLDLEIARVEKELAGLLGRRVQLLEEELRKAKAMVSALAGGPNIPVQRRKVTASPVPVETKRAEKPKTKSASAGTPTAPVQPRRGGAPAAPIPSDTKEAEKPGKKEIAGKQAKKRQRMSSQDARTLLIEEVRAAGKEGVSLKEASDNSGVNYQTALKIMNEMTDTFVKTGELKKARWTLKK